MPYSSGTTGLPKGVELTHSNIVSNITQLSPEEINYLQETTKEHQDVIPVILPIFHIYGLVITTILTLLRGCKNVYIPKFEPKQFIDILVNYKPNVLFVAPPLVLFMTNQDAVKPEYLSPVRDILSGAAPLGAADEQRFLAKAKKNITIGQGYGMTEASPVIALTNKKKRCPPGSTGIPVPNTEFKIVDISNPNGPSLGPNQTGELLVRGPQIMRGYHNRPEETENTITDGWLRTGDIAFYDDDKNLTITDRLKELIKVKGFQVPPAELEEIIRKHPDVLDVGVIGIPHKLFGEVPRAFVTPKPGAQIKEQKLQEFVKDKVASYKELKGGVQIMDRIPKNASGKILRRELKDLYKKIEDKS
ncbi:hypothetical protein HHI36_010260 [Cryptolaemus montrouzieri]|uniref:Uncharacterized protein n=1 Tax=Cryptolaemus montrouzieri TaxID=559131 RepID=A0ABD2MI94_9CUCU